MCPCPLDHGEYGSWSRARRRPAYRRSMQRHWSLGHKSLAPAQRCKHKGWCRCLWETVLPGCTGPLNVCTELAHLSGRGVFTPPGRSCHLIGQGVSQRRGHPLSPGKRPPGPASDGGFFPASFLSSSAVVVRTTETGAKTSTMTAAPRGPWPAGCPTPAASGTR